MESTYYLAKAILKPWLAAWFRWSIEGLDNLPRSGPAIVAFNHISYLDPFVAAYVLDAARRRPRFLAKSELFQDKRIAWILKGTRQIEVRRGTRDAPIALDQALESLERGEAIVVVPEGTVTTDPELRPMAGRSGAARLAVTSGAPVVPAALWGTQNIWPKGYAKHWWPPKQDVLVRIGDPMTLSTHDSPAGWQQATRAIMEAICLLLAGLVPAVPDRRRPKKPAA